MAKNKWRIGAAIQGSKRDLLIRLCHPSLARIYCQGITEAYGVGPDYQFPQGVLTVKVTGIHRTAIHEALVCTVNGQTHRPDGKLYHITLSTAADVAPRHASDIDPQAVEPIQPIEIAGLRFSRDMLRPMRSDQNVERIAA